MSLFKTREYWSTLVGQGEEFDAGCLCVADIDNKGSDKVIVGSYHGYVRIYQPASASRAENEGSGNSPDDVVCEIQLSLPILQLEAGRFVSGSDNVHLAVLHPRKFAVYTLTAQAGITDHGKQYQLSCIYEHKLQRTAYNFCYGPFGGVKGRDFTCIQSMDGVVSIFEQESFAFCRFLPQALLPGPIKYICRTDCFITVSSNQQVECYKFQVLATATDDKSKQETQNITSGRRVSADWIFLVNETAIDLVVTNFPNAPLTIFVLGERNLYALSDSGQLTYLVKFDFNPSCFLPFCAGKNDTVNSLICTHAKTLLVYQNTSLKWAAQMPMVPVQVKVANFQDSKGAIVAIDEEGHLQCCYLGTDPSMFTRPTSDLREIDYASAEQEMQQLQMAIREQQNKSVLPAPSVVSPQEDLKLSIFIPGSFDKPSLARDSEVEDSLPVPSITVTVSLQAKTHLHDVKLSIKVVRPLVVSESFMTISSVEPGRPVEKQLTFYMKYRMLPTDLRLNATAVYYSSSGAPRVVHSAGRLPLLLVLRPCLPVKNASYKLTVDTNKSPVSLMDIFSDMLEGGTESSSNAVAFKYYGLDPVVTVLASKSSQRYRIQCDEFAYMWHVLSDFTSRLSGHFKMSRASDFSVSYESPLPLQEYFEVIDRHFECRSKHSTLAKILEERASQFRAVQKRLLMLYKDKTPAPLNGLDHLLESTYKQVLSLADTVEENRLQQEVISSALSCSTRLICLLIKLRSSGMTPEDFSILESCLTPIVDDNSSQGWEEIVDASITHLLRTVLSKNAKDIVVNPSPLALHRDTEKVKKHISLLCDRLSKGARLSEGGTKGEKHNRSSEKTQNLGNRSQEDFGDDSIYAGEKSISQKGKSKANTTDASSDSFYASDYTETKQPLLASGDTTSFSVPKPGNLPELNNGGRFVKKAVAKSTDSVPDLDDLGQEENSEVLKSNQEELVFGL